MCVRAADKTSDKRSGKASGKASGKGSGKKPTQTAGTTATGRALALISAAVLVGVGVALAVIAWQNQQDDRGYDYHWQPSKAVGIAVTLVLTAAAIWLCFVAYTVLWGRSLTASTLVVLAALEAVAYAIALAFAVFTTLKVGWTGATGVALGLAVALVPLLVAVRLEREPPRLATPAPRWARATSGVIVGVGVIAAIVVPVRARHTAEHAFYYPFGVLPAAVQPPDPCTLLTDEEVSQAAGQKMISHPPSLLADPKKGVRACFWFAEQGSGLFSLSLSTPQALAATGASGDLRGYFDKLPKDATPVPGVGEDARYLQSGQQGTIDVLLANALLQIDDAAHTATRQQFLQQDMTSLAQSAAQRFTQLHG
jgi:hypothetical protein